jgi:hypothetical protein
MSILLEAKRIEEQFARNQKFYSQLCEGLDRTHVKIINEAQISASQINALFKTIEQTATAGGANRTAVGQGKDVVDAVGKIVKDAAKWVQNTTPVQGFDAKFEQLKGSVGAKFPELDKQLTGLGTWAKENPGKTAAIIGVLTALAGVAGGPIGGAIAGQALKGAAELIKGEKVSTAIGKGVKTAAIGALAGGVFNQISAGIDQLLPPEITNTFINDASGEIDITKLSGMGAQSLEALDADAASELIQSRTALAELAGQGDLGAEANKVLQDQISQLDDKIVALGAPDGGSVNDAIDAIQAEKGIEGIGANIEKTTSVGDAADATEVTGNLSSEQLNQAGINSADIPNNEWLEANNQRFLDAGMTQEQIDQLQKIQGLDRAMAQKEFLNTNISADTMTSVGDDIAVEGVPSDAKVGEVFRSNVTKTLPDGTEYGGIAEVEITGTNPDGTPLYKMKSVTIETNPYSAALDKAMENLPPELADELQDNVLSGTVSGSIETAVDDMMQNIIKGTAAAGIGASLAGVEANAAQREQGQAQESRRRRGNSLTETQITKLFIATAYNNDKHLMEAPNFKGMLGKAKQAIGKGATAAGDAISKGAQAGLAKAQQVGTNITTKVTADKLMKAWNKAGKPTDTVQVATLISNFGVDPGVMAQSYQTAGLKMPKIEKVVSNDPIQNLVSKINALPAIKDKVIQYLTLATKPAQPTANPTVQKTTSGRPVNVNVQGK